MASLKTTSVVGRFLNFSRFRAVGHKTRFGGGAGGAGGGS